MTQTSLFEGNKLWDAIGFVLRESTPYNLQIECMAEFCKDLMAKDFDGKYNRAANHALLEWDI